MMAEDNDEIVIDLREIFGILKKRIGMVAGIAALFVVCAVGYCFIKAPVYEAVSIIGYSCARKPHDRRGGNRQSGLRKPLMRVYSRKFLSNP